MSDINAHVMAGKTVTLKFTLERLERPRGRVQVYLYFFFNLGARWGGWSTPRPDRFTPGRRCI